MIWAIIVLTHSVQVLSHDWSRLDSGGCSNCMKFIANTNFTTIISFESKVLLGARNSVYQINFLEQTYHEYVDTSEPSDLERCSKSLGQSEEDCQNYYKVILRLTNADLFICGTNAFNPVCGVRTKTDLSYSTHTNNGIGICPANPKSSTTYLKLKDSTYGFAGTERASSSVYTISLINLRYDSYKVEASTKMDDHWLKKPDFIYSFEYGDHVYFILKEIAVEVMNIEQIYSRIVRICKDDHGSPSIFLEGNFMTFIKARLFCSFTKAGQAPYDFNEIAGAYYYDGYVYGVFSGPSSVIDTGSVLCRYSMAEIEHVFSGKAKYFSYGRWSEEDEPKPFNCTTGRTLEDALRNQLMSKALISTKPVVYSPTKLSRLTVTKSALNGIDSIIIHAGQSGGKVLRVGFPRDNPDAVRTSELNLELNEPVLELAIAQDKPYDVFAMSYTSVTYIPLHAECPKHTTCHSCQTSFPVCGWCKVPTGDHKCSKKIDCIDGTWSSPFSVCPRLPRFDETPQPTEVVLTEKTPEQTIVLRCRSRDVKPEWSKVSGQISNTALFKEDNTQLVLSVKKYADKGVYICNLNGDGGRVEARAAVDVKIAPRIVESTDEDVTVIAGEEVILVCASDGYPRPATKWFKRHSSELPEGAKLETNGNLRIIRTVLEDAGYYYCEVDNNVGTKQTSEVMRLIVKEKGGKTPNGEATSDPEQPFDHKKLIIMLCGVVVIITVISIIIHILLRRRQRNRYPKNRSDMMYPVTYHEEVLGDYIQTPTTILTPDGMDQNYRRYLPPRAPSVRPKVHFEWGQPMTAQPMTAQPFHHMISPEFLGEEPPPAYHAEIELHQPPEIPTRRPITGPGGSARQLSTPSSSSGSRPIPPPDTFHHPSSKPHFFTPVVPAHRLEESTSSPQHDSRDTTPSHHSLSGVVSPTDPDIAAIPQVNTDSGEEETASSHEYERIGLLSTNNTNNIHGNVT